MSGTHSLSYGGGTQRPARSWPEPGWCGCGVALVGREVVAVGNNLARDSRLRLVGRPVSGGYGSETGPLAVWMYWIAVWALTFALG